MDGGVEGVDTTAGEEDLAFHAIVPEIGVVISNYICGTFLALDFSAESTSIAIIACVGPRALLVVPGECWDKKVKSRKLPKGALEQAINVRVPGCGLDDRENPLDECTLNVWIGCLKADFGNYIDFTSSQEPTTGFLSREAADQCLPLAQALVDAANEKFNLVGSFSILHRSNPGCRRWKSSFKVCKQG